MMENFNFTIYITRFVVCCSQQAAESFKYVVYFRNYWGRQCTTCLSSTFVSASSHAHHFYFHLNIFFVCQIILQIQFYYFYTYIFFPNQKLFYSNRRRSFVELLTVAQIPKLRKSAATNNERHMADSSFGGSVWLSTTTIPKPSTSEEKALVILCESTSESVSREFQASRAFLFGLTTNNINNCDIFYVKTKFLLYIFWRRIGGALTFLVKSTGYLSKSTSPMISGWVRRESPFY